MEWIMWSLFPLGIPYSIWRMIAKKYVCSQCDGDILFPLDGVLGSTLSQASSPSYHQRFHLQPQDALRQAARSLPPDGEESMPMPQHVAADAFPTPLAAKEMLQAEDDNEDGNDGADATALAEPSEPPPPRARVDPDQW